MADVPHSTTSIAGGHTNTTNAAAGFAAIISAGDRALLSNAGGTAATWAQIVDAHISASAAITGSKIASADGSNLGVVKLAGDLGGTAASPATSKLNGATAPSSPAGSDQGKGLIVSGANALAYANLPYSPYRWGVAGLGNTTSVRYMTIGAADSSAATTAQVTQTLAETAGVARAIFVFSGAGNLSGANATWVLEVNGSNTAVTVTLNAGSQSANASGFSVALAAGDRVAMNQTATAAVATTFSLRVVVLVTPL